MCFGSKGAGGGPSTATVGGAALAGTAMGGPLLGAVIGLVGGAMSVAGTLREGKQQAAALESQARALEQQGERTADVASENIHDLNRKAREDEGTSKVAAAKSGVLIGGGSPVTARKRIKAEYQRTASRYGKDVADRIHDLDTQAHYLRKTGSKALKASRTSALGQGLNVASTALQYDWKSFMGKKTPEA